VPVKVYPAAQSKQIRFRELHAKDAAPLEHRRMCSKEGKEVPYDEIVRGYETAPGRYVVLTKEEIQAAAAERGKTIDLEDFVPGDEIDPVYYDTPYWLGPQAGAEEAYGVLRAALEKAGVVGVGRFVLRTKEQLVAVHAVDGALRLDTMRFHDEVIDPEDLDIPEPAKSVTDREAKMADALVSSLEAEFDPAEYEDTYRERVLEVVMAKAKGEQIVPSEPVSDGDGSADLMALLEQSLGGAKKRSGGAAKKSTRKGAGKSKTRARR
jgi:DNA end-binding protein Ku